MRRFVQAFASSSDLPENWPAEVREAIAASPDHYNLGRGDEAWVVRSVDGALQTEPSREPRRPFCVSHAAIGSVTCCRS